MGSSMEEAEASEPSRSKMFPHCRSLWQNTKGELTRSTAFLEKMENNNYYKSLKKQYVHLLFYLGNTIDFQWFLSVQSLILI